MSDSLLGKKRCEESDKEKEKEKTNTKKKKVESNKKDEEKDEEEESSSSDGQPRQSLFGNNEKGFTGGLFGDLDNPQKPTSLFDNSQKSTNLFDNPQKPTSLFDKPKEGTSLFGNTGGSLFGNNQSEEKTSGGLFSGALFDFSNINKKKEDEEEEGDGDDNIGKSNSPKHEYNPENENNENKPDKDGYIKRYIKKVDNILLYDKLRNTYISKGEGFIIIETQEKENENNKKERFAIILYRNSIGGIIFQGIVHDKINKCVSYEKKLKYICYFSFLIEQNDEKNKYTLGQAKIPFSSLDESNKFSEKYENTIKYIKNEIDDF